MTIQNKQIVNQLLEDNINQLPAIDCHTYLDAAHMSARGLHDILLDTLVIQNLYCAGCPDRSDLSLEPDEKEIRDRIEHAIPYLPKIENTAMYWGFSMILTDLYNWHERITNDNWRHLHDRISEKSSGSKWSREILRRSSVERAFTKWYLRDNGSADDILDYTFDLLMPRSIQQGQNDMVLCELENIWQKKKLAQSLPAKSSKKSKTSRQIKTIEDIRSAIKQYCDIIPFNKIISISQCIFTDVDYCPVSNQWMNEALKNRDNADTKERNAYISYVLETFLKELEKHAHKVLFQFYIAHGLLQYASAVFFTQLADMIERHPKLRFQCVGSNQQDNQILCNLCRQLPNLNISGYWQDGFFPGEIKQICTQRLDMLALNRQIGFVSNACCMEWLYARSKMTRSLIVEVLVDIINRGQYSYNQAVNISKYILKNSAEEIFAKNK